MISEAEYLEQDRAPERLWGHEYWDGVVNERIPCSFAHSLMVTELTMLFRTALRGTEWTALHSGLRVHIPAHRAIVYPDFMIVGPEPKFYDDVQDTLLNPRVVIEVVSQHTWILDHGAKAIAYRSIPSLADYVLIALNEIEIEHHARSEGRWAQSMLSRATHLSLALEGVDDPVNVSSIYDEPEALLGGKT